MPPSALEFHPRHGTHDPTSSSPRRVPHSLRRTSTIDMLWPGGPGHELTLRGRARDLRTDGAGQPSVVDEAEIVARIDYADGRELREIRTVPDRPATAGLVGTRASTGFRAAVDELVPGERDARSLLYLLLDDVPVAALVAGYSLGAAVGLHTPAPRSLALQHPDLCAGWRTGGTIMSEIEDRGRVPIVTGPAAPSLLRADDPHAWHAFEALPAHAMRRHRRLDLVAEADAVIVDVLFRDSHMRAKRAKRPEGPERPEGPAAANRETIVHEYTVRARIEAASLEILEIEATPQVLPWIECPAAAASARDLLGLKLDGLRPHVRSELVGAGTCTHLNDTLRSLEDVVALAGAL